MPLLTLVARLIVDKPDPTQPTSTDSTPSTGPRRTPANRGAEPRDVVAEMTERAQIISQEAATKVALAMRDAISGGAAMAGFAMESVRDLVQYLVRRGQMTEAEADKLIREAGAGMVSPKPPLQAPRRRPSSSIVADPTAASASNPPVGTKDTGHTSSATRAKGPAGKKQVSKTAARSAVKAATTKSAKKDVAPSKKSGGKRAS